MDEAIDKQQSHEENQRAGVLSHQVAIIGTRYAGRGRGSLGSRIVIMAIIHLFSHFSSFFLLRRSAHRCTSLWTFYSLDVYMQSICLGKNIVL